MTENSNNIKLKDLKQQIESLEMIMKGATVGNIKPQMFSGAPPEGKRKCLVVLLRNLFKGPPDGLQGLKIVPQVLLFLDKNL